ncbi:uncharacterized protein GGS22DRAFT_152194 [Annulohypoxylon maeteangense]|uniref:uncharacterized protein n=1 Tax=Annulohypoxylon maeteangense TaxID=1927788 RepID=UPI002008C5E8|nr:uncharacterized protein GGS22DRAFT_152194 [Annulohypoxylon maeteangense]KAI0888702.1 hypothetical protein GGS22DRAFT_152194 [Annulohypoxylon maeteangense]
MSQKVLRRRDQAPGSSLQAVLTTQEYSKGPIAIPSPPENADEVKAKCDSFLFESFTVEDAWELGHHLYARLLPFAPQKPTLISISLATGQVVFQCAVGSGTVPDNELWVQRKRNTVLRFGTSTWFQHCKYAGDEEAFRVKFGMSPAQAENYAIHGGGVPIRVKGVEGIVGVVIVSGLKQNEDHGVIVDVINENWQ